MSYKEDPDHCLDCCDEVKTDLEAKLAVSEKNATDFLGIAMEVGSLRAKLSEAQAQAAAMRKDLEHFQKLCPPVDGIPLKSLSSDAGRALLAELKALREVENRLRTTPLRHDVLCHPSESVHSLECVAKKELKNALARVEEVRRKA